MPPSDHAAVGVNSFVGVLLRLTVTSVGRLAPLLLHTVVRKRQSLVTLPWHPRKRKAFFTLNVKNEGEN